MATYTIGTSDSKDLSIFNTMADIADTPLTASSPFVFKQTWNNGSVAFSGLEVDITNTASSNSSSLLNVKINGNSKLSLVPPSSGWNSGGQLVISTSGGPFMVGAGGNGATIGRDHHTQIGGAFKSSRPSDGYFISIGNVESGSNFTNLYSGITEGVISQRKGAVPQEYRLYNTTNGTTTEGTNNEYFRASWSATSNTLTLGTVATGTGVVRNIEIGGGTTHFLNTTDLNPANTSNPESVRIWGGLSVAKTVRVGALESTGLGDIKCHRDRSLAVNYIGRISKTSETLDGELRLLKFSVNEEANLTLGRLNVKHTDGIVFGPQSTEVTTGSLYQDSSGSMILNSAIGYGKELILGVPNKAYSLAISAGGYRFHAADPLNSTKISVPAAGVLAIEDGTNPQEQRVYNTTDGTNSEYFAVSWQKTSNTLTIGTYEDGSGTVRNIEIAGGKVTILNEDDLSPDWLTRPALDIKGGLAVAKTIDSWGYRSLGGDIQAHRDVGFSCAERFGIVGNGVDGEVVFRKYATSERATLLAKEIKTKVRFVNVTADFELDASNEGQDVIIRVDSATPVAATIAAGMPVGTRWQIRQVGTGAATITAGGGQTLNGPYWTTAGQWSSISVDVPAAETFESEGAI